MENRRYALGHIVGDPVKGWEDFVIHDGPLVKDGRILIPDKPGLGVEPNPDHVRAHLAPGETCGAELARFRSGSVRLRWISSWLYSACPETNKAGDGTSLLHRIMVRAAHN